MHKKSKKYKNKIHTKPGSLIYTGDNHGQTSIILTSYSENTYESIKINSVQNLNEKLNSKNVFWLHITGLNNKDFFSELSKTLDIHPLVMEDILEISGNPKIESYGEYLFIITKNIFFENDKLNSNQISFILKDNLVITFEDSKSNIFHSVYKRIEEASNIRKFKSDYLLYSLLDCLVDNYFYLLEELGYKIDLLEDELLLSPDKEVLDKIYLLKKDIIYIKNVIWPMRNLISAISRNEYNFIDEKTVYYFRDIYDHIIQIVDLIETSRDICSGMLDTYLSSIGNRTNEVMKVLTIASTVSIPLTFLTGVFGMNFKYFPLLNWKYAYPTFWILSAGLTLLMISYFKKKDWL